VGKILFWIYRPDCDRHRSFSWLPNPRRIADLSLNTTSPPNGLLCGSLKDLHGAAHFPYDVDIKWTALDAHLAFDAL
jgi:hypothetical protein